MRTLFLAPAATAVLWWLLRPRRRGRRADRYAASPEPTYRAVRTFRTPGGVATTVWQATWRNGGPVRWHSWTCDCGGGVEGYDMLREAAPDAIAHHEAHGR